MYMPPTLILTRRFVYFWSLINKSNKNANYFILNNKMRDIGTRLNLKGHMAGLGVGQERKFLVAPTDIEG